MVKTNATAVSRFLGTQGFRPSYDRRREGIRVSNSVNAVFVVCDLDSEAQAEKMACDVYSALSEKFEVSREANRIVVRGRR